jgi:phosphoglycerate dehydrogenase-like enzyme
MRFHIMSGKTTTLITKFAQMLTNISALAVVVWFQAPAAVAQSGVPDIASLDAVEKRLIEHYNMREGSVAMRDAPGWAPIKKIVVRDIYGPGSLGTTQARLDWISKVAPGIEFVAVESLQEAIDQGHMRDAQAIIGIGCSPSLIFSFGPEVHWTQSSSSGVAGCFYSSGEDSIKAHEMMLERNIVLTNQRGVNSIAVAEHALALMLALIQGVDIHIRRQDKEIWGRSFTDRVKDPNIDWELDGRTLLIAGLGTIGTEIARRANALGMRVIATRNSSRSGPDFVDYVGLAHELNELAGQADVVLNQMPLTAETFGILNTEFFEAMKPTAYFINMARGSQVVNDDLVDALRQGKIAGAALEALDPEPLPSGHPLWTMPRVIITPHVSDYSDKHEDTVWDLYRENLRRYIAGDKLLNVVDMDKGY